MDSATQLAGGHLFAYGTLHPDRAPDEIADLVRRFEIVGKGFVQGSLYDLGAYPGAVLDDRSSRRVFGTVFRFPPGADALPRLDAYEGFEPQDPERSLFVRRLRPVCLIDGPTLSCWVYEYNGSTGSARVIETGIYPVR